MKDPILLNKLWKEVEAGRVNVSQSGPLSIFKYTQDCHIKDEWNDVNRQARGLIFHTDGTVVARPFEKFFNLGERPETSHAHLPNEPYEVFEKVDGSCGIGYFGTSGPDMRDPLPTYEEDPELYRRTFVRMPEPAPMWRLATPGSMESDQAIEGTRMLNGQRQGMCRFSLEHLPKDCTPVFEIIYPENRIVVDYHGTAFLSLLAIFEHNGVEWHPRRVDQIAALCGFRRPDTYTGMSIKDEFAFEENSEGYVVRFEGGMRLKIKSPTYLRIHRLLNYLSPKGVIELIRGKEYGVTVKQLPDTIASDFDDVRAYVQTMHDTLLTAAYESLRELQGPHHAHKDRKAQAAWIIENVPADETGFVFSLLDGKDIEDKIWSLVQQRVKDEHSKVAVE